MLRTKDVNRHLDRPILLARLELDLWRVTFAHDLSIWERGA